MFCINNQRLDDISVTSMCTYASMFFSPSMYLSHIHTKKTLYRFHLPIMVTHCQAHYTTKEKENQSVTMIIVVKFSLSFETSSLVDW